VPAHESTARRDLSVDEIIASVAPEEIEQTVLPYVERVAAWGDEIRMALNEQR
jgi:hypothetical protein